MYIQYPVISIIVPIFNAEKYLAACIDSILNQSYKNIEVILVNDGSTDNSIGVCRRYCEADIRVIVVDKPNEGVNSARKEGARVSRGDYIVCIDADDWIESDTLERLLDLEPRADVYTFCYYEEGDGYSEIKKNVVEEGLYAGRKKMKDLYTKMLMDETRFDQGVFSSLCNKMIRRDIYVKNQMTVPNSIYYGEDTACTYPCLLDSGSVWVTNMPLYHYRLRADSCVRSARVCMENFRTLYYYLEYRFCTSDYEELLTKQLRLYTWQALLLKAYDRINSDMTLFPFEKIETGMRVAIYGAGLFGQVIMDYCQKSRKLTIAGWFDKRHDIYSYQGLPVLPCAEVLCTDFDVMVIAILNVDIAEHIKEDYIRQGIAESKIDIVNVELLKKLDIKATFWSEKGEY